ncbi:MAG: hypothetical protein CMO80_24600 [Verrucomicrobiales bacterium]|nr:hypothetical protein [Verrucomicrobiales bacterium]|tara:strand:- start:60 stop:332 length:273 start_codon:yes stop_codon:yes gene_type:complete
MKIRLLLVLVFVMFLAFTPDAEACVACFGQNDGKMAQGMNAGIFSLLAVITSVLITFMVFMVFIVRRNAKYSHVMLEEAERIRLQSEATV